MTKYSYDLHHLAPRMCVAALAVIALAACSSPTGSAGSTVGPSTPPVTVTVTPPPTPPPVTVTVTPPPAAAHYTGAGSFQSPSGNIHCALFSDTRISAQCEVANRTWTAPPKESQCHLNWGSRISLQQGGGAAFACYGQELPPAQRTLDYGATWSVGTITCTSDSSAGITCTDNGTGHHFAISRDTYRLG